MNNEKTKNIRIANDFDLCKRIKIMVVNQKNHLFRGDGVSIR